MPVNLIRRKQLLMLSRPINLLKTVWFKEATVYSNCSNLERRSCVCIFNKFLTALTTGKLHIEVEFAKRVENEPKRSFQCILVLVALLRLQRVRLQHQRAYQRGGLRFADQHFANRDREFERRTWSSAGDQVLIFDHALLFVLKTGVAQQQLLDARVRRKVLVVKDVVRFQCLRWWCADVRNGIGG